MHIAVPDLISPSYFPAIAAVELGYAREAGVDLELHLRFPVTEAVAALRDGSIDFLAGAAHAPAYLVDGWRDVVLLAALSQHMYWFLVARSDLGIARGDLNALHSVRIGAAPGPDLGLLEMLHAAGVDLAARNIEIVPVRGADRDNVSFGVTAADALAAGSIDAFWANGMGAEVALRQGTGSLIVDARRSDGPPGSRDYTFAALMTTRRLLAEDRTAVDSVTASVRRAQSALCEDPALATRVGKKLVPPMEAELISTLIERDTPYYSPLISDQAVRGLSDFVSSRGLSQTDGHEVRAVGA